MNLINKDNYKISTIFGNGSNNSKLKFAIISDELVSEIEGLYYQDGTYTDEEGIEQPNMVNLNLIDSIIYQEVDGQLFDEVSSINYKATQPQIDTYLENQAATANYEFFEGGYKYRITIDDFDRYSHAGYGDFTDFCKVNPDIKLIGWNKVNGSIVLHSEIFLNDISDEHLNMINNDVYTDTTDKVFTLQINLDF